MSNRLKHADFEHIGLNISAGPARVDGGDRRVLDLLIPARPLTVEEAGALCELLSVALFSSPAKSGELQRKRLEREGVPRAAAMAVVDQVEALERSAAALERSAAALEHLADAAVRLAPRRVLRRRRRRGGDST